MIVNFFPFWEEFRFNITWIGKHNVSMGNSFEQWKREPSSHLFVGIRLTLFIKFMWKLKRTWLKHRVEMTTWIILKKGPPGKIMHHLSVEFAHIFYSVTQVGLEKCVILLHVPKLVIISKGEYTILLSTFPRNENCMKLKFKYNVIEFLFYLKHWISCGM